MARRSVVVSGRQNRGPRRATQWLGSALGTDVIALAAGASTIDQTFAFVEPATIVRTRGSIWVTSDQVATTEHPFGALGVAVVTDQAAAAGVASVPTPITENDSDDWLLWTPFAQSVRFASGIGFDSQAFSRFDFDSKAMRKVDDNSTAVVMIENSSATDGLFYVILFRMLIMLHG